jgi:peptidoglycan hydrolase-like protein with peptidoglycan-binding domain
MGIVGRSVGAGGTNARADVTRVQEMLNAQLGAGKARLKRDGIAGPLTVRAIEAFQRRRVGMIRPDGLVEFGRRTAAALGQPAAASRPAPRPPARAAAAASRARTVAAPGAAGLSGARWWHANQGRYPNSASLDSLAEGFRDKARRFVAALRAAGATVRVSSTRRNRIRAHLMHYSWRVAKGQVAPGDVPAITGLDIEWDHGDLATSRAAAREMVRLFGIVFKPSLTSNHVQGTAVDMTITRPGTMSVVDAAGRTINVSTNAALHHVGGSYGVLKLASDPPHWSANGR